LTQLFFTDHFDQQLHSIKKGKRTFQELAPFSRSLTQLRSIKKLSFGPAMATQGTVRMVIRNVQRDALELEMNNEDTIGMLKLRISEHWRVPATFQKLVLGSAVLGDTALLGEYAEKGVLAQPVVMVISTHKAMRDLEHRNKEHRMRALHALAELGPRGGDAVIDAIVPLLESSEDDVRRAAVMGLAHTAGKEHTYYHAIRVMSAKLAHPYESVRRAALEAIAKIAERGDDAAISAMVPRMSHGDSESLRAAARALKDLVEKGDTRLASEARFKPTVRPECMATQPQLALDEDATTGFAS